MEIAIVGAGVSGLTTGVVLQRNGFKTKIFTKDDFQNTVSAVAAAIWHPFQSVSGNNIEWMAELTYKKLVELAGVPGSGVSVKVLNERYEQLSELPWWTSIPQKNSVADPSVNRYKEDYYRIKVPVADTEIYLGYLQDLYISLGGEIVKENIGKLDSLLESFNAVVNCAGLAARHLTEDDNMTAVRGAVFVCKKQDDITECYIDDIDPEWPTYVIVRENSIVIGGSAHQTEQINVPENIFSKIKNNVMNKHGIHFDESRVISRKVGFRPYRTTVRVEVDPANNRIFHNYGHGGSGYSLSWGCAYHIDTCIQAFL